MDTIPAHIRALIIKFLHREASDAEVTTLIEWLKENETHRKYFDEINDTFQATVTMARFNQDRIDTAWQQVHRKINETKNGRFGRTTTIRKIHYNFLKVAAAVSALVVLSLVTWYSLDPYVRKHKHTIVHTSKRLNTQLLLPDGTLVWLNNNSTLEYPPHFGKTTREVYLKGEAFFDVKKDARSFIVKAQEVSVHVKGTRFNVRAYADENSIKTTLEEGKVEVLVNGVHDVYTMMPGEQITFNPKLGKITRDTVDPSDYTSWKEEKLVFDNTPLLDIILKLENRYKVDIVVDSSLAERERLTMTIEQESIEEVLEFIKLSSHLKYKKQKGQIFIYE